MPLKKFIGNQTFHGTGFNDGEFSGNYTGTNEKRISVVMVANNGAFIGYTGTGGFESGEIINDTNDFSSQVLTDNAGNLIVGSISGGDPTGNIITGQTSGATATVTSFEKKFDLFGFTDSSNNPVIVPRGSDGVIILTDGISITFGQDVDHTPGDEWQYHLIPIKGTIKFVEGKIN